VLSCVGGLLQFAPFWDPLSKWLDPVDAPVATARSWQEWFASGLSLAAGLIGIFIAWSIYVAKRRRAPRAVTLFEKKFYWDELYDVVWYRSADVLTRGLYAFVERPLIAGSLTAITGAFGLGSRELATAQNGLVRSYALALASGIAVLTVVFIAAR